MFKKIDVPELLYNIFMVVLYLAVSIFICVITILLLKFVFNQLYQLLN